MNIDHTFTHTSLHKMIDTLISGKNGKTEHDHYNLNTGFTYFVCSSNIFSFLNNKIYRQLVCLNAAWERVLTLLMSDNCKKLNNKSIMTTFAEPLQAFLIKTLERN